MTPGTQTATATGATKKASGGKGGKKNARQKQQKHHKDLLDGPAIDLLQQQQQRQPQSRVPPTGNEPELEPSLVEQHIGCSTCVVEIPCASPMCCLTKLACQRLECGGNVCNSLADYSKRAKELKEGISSVLERNSYSQTADQPTEVIKLKEDIQKLSVLDGGLDGNELEANQATLAEKPNTDSNSKDQPLLEETVQKATDSTELIDNPALNSGDRNNIKLDNPISVKKQSTSNGLENTSSHEDTCVLQNVADVNGSSSPPPAAKVHPLNSKKLDQENDRSKNNVVLPKTHKRIPDNLTKSTASEKHGQSESESQNKHSILRSEFEPLNNVNLDFESKYLTIISALKPHFKDAPHLLEPISNKLASMSDDYRQLAIQSEKQRLDNEKLEKIKQKLESLCRELQKSNNAIRVESLDLIKVEQGKTKEQNTKIQSTLSGVIKLFDENQQRNMSLRQENQELQTKLKSLLDHCDNWERSVETALRQREIENRLIKTELAKANLMKTEEKEKFLGEKQELLQILTMMQEQQHKIEGQEAKLRSDLSSYASKYDECQAVISKGMSRFQLESKKMLQQIEKSKQDYKVLLSKYESSNRRMVQLLEEKKCWDRAMSLANKKIDTLERLCRALSGRKLETGNKTLSNQNEVSKPPSNKNKNTKISKDTESQNENVTSTKKYENDNLDSSEFAEPARNTEDSVETGSAESIESKEDVKDLSKLEIQPQNELLT